MRKPIKLLRCLSTRPYARALLLKGVAAGVEHEAVLGGLDCRLVIDIGANRGQFALVARRCFPKASIVCFEPLPKPAAKLGDVFSGDGKLLLHRVAVGQSSMPATMHVSMMDDSSSLLPIGPLQTTLFPGTGEARVVDVRIEPLNAFLAPNDIVSPALLKVDVQGYELEALRGSESLLDRFAYVYVECSFVELYSGQPLADEVIDWLERRGFALRGRHNTHYDAAGLPIQADLFFVSGH